MVIIPETYIVGRKNAWLGVNRPDITQMPENHLWRNSKYEAKRFKDCKEARERAKRYGGQVYRFSSLTGKAELITPVKQRICDTCRKYTAFDGTCKNGSSEYYGVPVSIRDSCGEWGERT